MSVRLECTTSSEPEISTDAAMACRSSQSAAGAAHNSAKWGDPTHTAAHTSLLTMNCNSDWASRSWVWTSSSTSTASTWTLWLLERGPPTAGLPAGWAAAAAVTSCRLRPWYDVTQSARQG